MISCKNRRRKRTQESTEICLTPLIDVALTLLVIFMITSPMIQNSLKIELPEGQAQEAGKQEDQEMVVSIDKNEIIYFEGLATSVETLIANLKKQAALPASKKRVLIMIDKDKSCSAGRLISLIDSIKVVGGIKDVAIATQKPTTTQG